MYARPIGSVVVDVGGAVPRGRNVLAAMSAEQFQEDETSWLREQDLQHQIGFDLFWLCGGAGIMPKGGKRGREI
jgi:hypothetical protein